MPAITERDWIYEFFYRPFDGIAKGVGGRGLPRCKGRRGRGVNDHVTKKEKLMVSVLRLQ